VNHSELKTEHAQRPRLAFVPCGALAREVIAISKRHGWEVELFGVAAKDHMIPQRIAPDVERRLRELIPRFDRVIVVYGDCGAGGRLDAVLEHYNVPRIAGPHCYEMYAGTAFDPMMAEQPGTFFLTDFLVRSFEGTILKGMGLDRFPELRDTYFANYTRLVYLIQDEDPALLAKAQTIAATLGLPLELHRTSYGQLEARLVELVATIGEARYQPKLPDELCCKETHGNLSDSVLARHPRAGARARRRRSSEQTAA
jgi:Protein of unknown function (DUF1638)